MDPYDAHTHALLYVDSMDDACAARTVCSAWRTVVDEWTMPPLVARARAYANAIGLSLHPRVALRFAARYHESHERYDPSRCEALSRLWPVHNVAFEAPAVFPGPTTLANDGLWTGISLPCCAWTRRGALCARPTTHSTRLCSVHMRCVPFLETVCTLREESCENCV